MVKILWWNRIIMDQKQIQTIKSTINLIDLVCIRNSKNLTISLGTILVRPQRILGNILNSLFRINLFSKEDTLQIDLSYLSIHSSLSKSQLYTNRQSKKFMSLYILMSLYIFRSLYKFRGLYILKMEYG